MFDLIKNPWKTTDLGKMQKAIELIRTPGKYDIDKLIKIAKEAPLPEVRIAAWQEVNLNYPYSKDPNFNVQVYGFLHDLDPMVRKTCLEAASLEAASHVTPKIYRSALYDEDISVRRIAYEMLQDDDTKKYIPEGYDIDNPEASKPSKKVVDPNLSFIASQRAGSPRPAWPIKNVSSTDGVNISISDERTSENADKCNSDLTDNKTLNAGKTEDSLKSEKKPLLLKKKTRSNISSSDKKNIFIHSFSSQYSFEYIANMILAHEKGYDFVLWTAENSADVFNELDSIEFNRMQIYIPIVDTNYLDCATSTLSVDMYEKFVPMLIESGICVLPIFVDNEECHSFAKYFGELHGIFLSKPNFNSQIEEQLERMLKLNDVPKETIAAAFKRKIFLSYRKKNRDVIFDIMKSIHDTEKGSAASIWFDDFLIPGHDFNDEIKDNIDSCDDFVLAVTPQLLEEDNYVKSIEYPYANEKSDKNIVPISKEAVEYDSYRNDFPGLEKILSVDDESGINHSLSDISSDIDDETDYYEIYLRALSYLSGILTEKDISRAINMLEEASKYDIYESSAKLAQLYTEGFCVKKDSDNAYWWKKKTFNQLMDSEKEYLPEAEDYLHNILYGDDGLITLAGICRDEFVVDEITDKYLAYLKERKDACENKDVYVLRTLEAKIMRTDGHNQALYKNPLNMDKNIYDNWQDMNKCIRELYNLKISDKALNEERKRLLVIAYGVMTTDKGMLYPADEDYMEAIKILSESADSDSYENKKTMRALWMNLADHYKTLISSGRYNSKKEAYLKKMNDAYHNAIAIARELADERPYTNNLEMLFTILYGAAEAEFDVYIGMDYIREALNLAEKLEELRNYDFFSQFGRMKFVLQKALDDLNRKYGE